MCTGEVCLGLGGLGGACGPARGPVLLISPAFCSSRARDGVRPRRLSGRAVSTRVGCSVSAEKGIEHVLPFSAGILSLEIMI